MRPLELIIDGFRSFDRRTRFDWRGRTLVGIVGPIGSGKSTILDAISFALYSKTPVFERENKTLINHGRERARIELAFEIDGQSWRAVRVIRRKGASQHALFRTDAGAVDPSEPVSERERDMNHRVEQLLGLDFQGFNRSILLAQNRFARFLEASPTDRDRVLKGVFGFDRVDAMHEQAKQRRREAELTKGQLDGRLATLDDDLERLATARTSLERTAAAHQALEVSVEAIRELTRREQEAARTAHTRAARLEELDALAVRVPSSSEITEATTAADAARTRQAHAHRQRQATGRAVERAEADRLVAIERFGTAEALGEAERAVAVWERARRSVADLAKTEGGATAEGNQLRAAARAAAERGRAAEQAVLDAQDTVIAAEETRDAAHAARVEHVTRAGDDDALERARRDCDALDHAQVAAARAQTDREAEQGALHRAEASYDEAVGTHGDASACERAADAARQRADNALTEAEDALARAHRRNLAQSLADDLTIGEPCPVCARVVDEAPSPVASPVAEATEARDQARQAADRAQDASRVASNGAAAARQSMANADTARGEAQNRWRAAGERLRSNETQCSSLRATLTDRLGLGEPRERFAHIMATRARLVADERKAEQAVATARDALREARHQRDLAVEQAAAANAHAETHQQQCARAREAVVAAREEVAEAESTLHTLIGEGDPNVNLRAARDGLRAADARWEQARADEKRHQAEAETTARAVDAARHAEQALVGRLANLAGSLRVELPPIDDAGLPALKATFDERYRAALDGVARERDAAQDQATRAIARRAELLAPLNLGVDDDFDAASAAARAAWERDRAIVASLEQRLAEADDLATQRDEAERQLSIYRTLADELTAPRFLRYLLDEERASLADLGSRRFEMLSGGRYRFTEDGTFDVVDLANAEMVRKSETLSGGETFLASLALALALAETVTRVGGRLDAFFLDEGFGSLDDEHLDFAMEGIERLVTDAPNRLVTVVSHVHAMRDRIDDLIVLDKDPITGSSIVVRGATG